MNVAVDSVGLALFPRRIRGLVSSDEVSQLSQLVDLAPQFDSSSVERDGGAQGVDLRRASGGSWMKIAVVAGAVKAVGQVGFFLLEGSEFLCFLLLHSSELSLTSLYLLYKLGAALLSKLGHLATLVLYLILLRLNLRYLSRVGLSMVVFELS